MRDDSTENFLRLLNEQNIAIAARQAQEAEAQAQKQVGADPVRTQREAERREKWGELRARERPSKHPYRVRTIFGHIDLSE